MSMIDYGALVKVNGKIVNRNQFFMEMKDAVGWVDIPDIKYEDCDCINEFGQSDCQNCPRRQTYANGKDYMADCRGLTPNQEYGNKINNNYFAYVGDEELTVCVYKTHHIILINKDKENAISDWEIDGWKSSALKYVKYYDLDVNGKKVHIKVKRLSWLNRQFYMEFWHNNNFYQIVYGYGIDPNKKVWNKIKYRYCDKKVIRFVDRFWKERGDK